MALAADQPCGKAKTRFAQTIGLPDRKAGLLPPCGTAIFVRVAGDESKERRIRILAVENLCHWNRPCATMHLALIRSSFFLAFLEKYGPEDGKSRLLDSIQTIKDSLFLLLAPRPIHNNQDSY